MSSYRHPFDIRAPSSAYSTQPLTADDAKLRPPPAEQTGRGLLRRFSSDDSTRKRIVPRRSLYANLDEEDGRLLDPDDPELTGIRKRHIFDIHHEEKERIRLMDYRERRKYARKAKILFNPDTHGNRMDFVVMLAEALSKFGAPSHRIEGQLAAACKILGLRCTFVHLPTVIICEFGDHTGPLTDNRRCHVVDRRGQLSLGALHEVHQTYRQVVHDEISAKTGLIRLRSLMEAKPIYNVYCQGTFAVLLAIVICPLAFGGSLLDMWVAGGGALLLFLVQSTVATKCGTFYSNVWNILVTCVISFVARALGNIRDEMFCWTSISSAGIVGILPGFLILSSALELGTKNIVTGSMHMIYALICTLFLGFGLQFGSDFYLFLVPNSHIKTAQSISQMASTTTYTGTYAMDGSLPNDRTLTGSFTFTNSSTLTLGDLVNGCYRPASFPWYQQPFPWQTEFILVPAFAILLALANMQPYWTWDFPVMIVIAICSYISNKVASHLIFGHSDIVASVGAFAVGMLGNIYSRIFGGTAFTVMVPGVLFLVPSGLSEAGGIDAEGHGIALGYAMLQVTVGISVGLFMSCAIVYLFGKRKSGAVFTF
ncbi:DUF1212-domain-containing protein [Rhodofomes roseus]|nr:DUF1212-domain-containing protein [Rhodofomes roseus]KAH9832935.1 DUF1212-domain-containing protein [Rhodofomes roseus]